MPCPPPHFFLQYHGNQVKWRRRPIIPDLADAPRPSFLSLPESLRTRVVLWKSVSPPSAKRHRATAAAAIAAAQSSFTEFKTCCLICVDSTERERGLFSAHSFSLSLNPFPSLLFCSLFPGASSARLSDGGRARWSERTDRRARAGGRAGEVASDRDAAPNLGCPPLLAVGRRRW